MLPDIVEFLGLCLFDFISAVSKCAKCFVVVLLFYLCLLSLFPTLLCYRSLDPRGRFILKINWMLCAVPVSDFLPGPTCSV